MALSPGIRSAKRMGTSEVLCSVKVTWLGLGVGVRLRVRVRVRVRVKVRCCAA